MADLPAISDSFPAALSEVAASNDVEVFASLIAGMSRLLYGLSQAEPFANEMIGLAEWSALALVARTNGMNSGLLAKILGVSNQRAVQIAGALRRDGLITVGLATNNPRKKVILITKLGKAKLGSVNQKLGPMIVAALGKRTKSLLVADWLVNRGLMTMVAKRATRP
jgi:DNA-binding MarR family transcriptional regulator